MRKAIAAGWAAAAILVGSLAATPASADLSKLIEDAKKEGELTWYVASIDGRNAETTGKAFTEKYGIKVNVVRAASQIMFQRLAQDLKQKVANADVFSSVDLGNFVTLKKQGALAKYQTVTEKELLEPFRNLDPDDFYHATVASVIVIAYNTDKVKGDDIP